LILIGKVGRVALALALAALVAGPPRAPERGIIKPKGGQSAGRHRKTTRAEVAS
jgi:hypothetical protein